MDGYRAKRRAAGFSLAFNIVSTILKCGAAVFTGSVGLLSEAIHSATDVFSSSIALASVRAAAAPPDEDHPFGHGKIESLAGFGESVMLFGIVVYVMFEAIHRLFDPVKVEQVGLGLWTMGFSAIGALGAGIYVKRIADSTRSLALASNSQHLLVDCVTSLGVLLGLAVVHLTGLVWADSVMALVFAGWMGFGAWKLSRVAFQDLIDVRLPVVELAQIKQILDDEPDLISFHRLRTRRSGNLRHIDLHIVVPRDWTVVQSHDLADALEKRIEDALDPAQVVIHVDPLDLVKAQHSS